MIEQNGRIHNQVAELLSAYIDGEVVAEERALVEAHLATCATCAGDLATLRQTVAWLGQLPRVAAPRPFTLRESDVAPMRPVRPAWWRLPWVQGVAAATAVLLCVVAVGGMLLLGRTGLGGAPAAAPKPMALQEAPASIEAAKEEVTEEGEVAVVEKEMEEAMEVPASAPATATEYSEGKEVAVEEAPAEAPAGERATEAESLADVGEAEPPPAAAPPQATASPRAVANEAAAPTPVPGAGQVAPEETATVAVVQSPIGTPSPSPEALAAAPTRLEVEDVVVEIEPGVVHVSGRLPLPEGRRLAAELWRDGHPIDWAMPEGEPATVGGDGQFSLELQARSAAPDFDLFAIEPASYEIRIRPVDPPGPEEARIPFDTYGPSPAEPTGPPAEYSKEEARATSTSEPTPAKALSSKGEISPAATPAMVAPRNRALSVSLCGVGVVILLLAGLVGISFFRTRR